MKSSQVTSGFLSTLKPLLRSLFSTGRDTSCAWSGDGIPSTQASVARPLARAAPQTSQTGAGPTRPEEAVRCMRPVGVGDHNA